jgi:hypothetical protein
LATNRAIAERHQNRAQLPCECRRLQPAPGDCKKKRTRRGVRFLEKI